MKAGIYPNVSFEDYRSWPGWSSSDLKALRQGPPALVPWRRANPSEHTDATLLGTFCHAALLEGDSFAERFAQKPSDMNFSTKGGKAWKASQGGKQIITAKQFELVQGIVAAVWAKPLAADSLERASNFEASILWDQDGVALKARPDWYDDEAVVDLKVSRYATERTVGFRSWCEGWLNQIVFYRAALNAVGVPVKRGRLVVVHPVPPHPVFLIEVKENVMDLLALDNARDVKRLAAYEASGVWPGTPEEWLPVDLPAAALAESFSVLDGTEAENA